jgi:hypothetical protein
MHVDFAQRLADASTLQCAGRVATSHVRLVANPQEADMVRLTAMPVTCDERWYPGSGCLYAFTSDGTAPAG